MKKSKRLPIAIVLIFALAIWVLTYFLYSDRPFETIDIKKIEEIKVYAIPPNEEVVLDETEVERLIPLLQNLKISKPGYKELPSGGQTVSITIKKVDGSIIEISNIGNVRIMIDGRNYRAEYESAEAINNFVNKVLETGF